MRLKFLRNLYILLLVAVVIRLFYWQIIKSDDLTARAEQQHMVNSVLTGPRGSILASDGAILASNKPTFSLYGNPNIVKDRAMTADKLALPIVYSRLGKDEVFDQNKFFDEKKYLIDQLSTNLNWVLLDKNIDLSTKETITKLNLEGIGFENQLSRFYPESSSAAHILGFVGSDTIGRPTGYFGVEGFYNGRLSGREGIMTEEQDAAGSPILLGTFFKQEPIPGNNLVLNIDRTIQYIVESKLKNGFEKYGAKVAEAIVMDPKTGAILAMASYPNYDPGNFSIFPKEYFRNPLVADSFEPGSIFKVLVMAAALNEKLVKPDTKCDICVSPVEIANYQIKTWDNKYFPDSTMTDVIIHSDNTGMVYVSRKLGIDKLYQYIQNFGFGTLTGLDLQDETSPDIRPKKEWRDIDLATASFGQGIAVTGIQIVRAVSVIANGGYLMEPHIVKQIQIGGETIEIKPKVISKVLDNTATRDVTQMMVDAVDKGEARYFTLKDFKIAGKTGTAQIPVAGHYDPNKTIASFVGFAPADDPKFVMLVSYQEPSSSIFGAETAAPTFFEIAKQLLIYFNIAPK